MAGNKNRNWARVAVMLSEDDTLYLIGIINADVRAMSNNADRWVLTMQMAQRTRQKLRDALRSSNAEIKRKSTA